MDNKIPTISYAAHEGMMARMERTIRRLWKSAAITVLRLADVLGCNIRDILEVE